MSRYVLAALVAFTAAAGATALLPPDANGDAAHHRAAFEQRHREQHLYPDKGALLHEMQERYGRRQYSLKHEETLVRALLDDMRDGYFVDVGASHYEKLSNTYYLERYLGWRGIGIDPQPRYAADYARYRPRTRYLEYFVGDPASSGQLIPFFVDPDNEYKSSGVEATLEGASVEVQVPSITLDELLVNQGVDRIDFLNMDIEDAEPAALAGFSITRWQPRLVCIEMHPTVSDQIDDYLTGNGYVRMRSVVHIDPLNGYYVPRGDANVATDLQRLRRWGQL